MVKFNKDHIKQVSSLSILQLVLAVCAYATQIRLTHEVSAGELGRIAYGIAIGLWLQVIVRMAYDRTLVRSIFDNKDNSSNVQLIIIRSLILRGLVFLIATLVFGLALNDLYVALIAVSMAVVGLDIYPWFDSYGYTTVHAKIQVCGKFIYFIPIWGACLFNLPLSIEVISILLLSSSLVILLFQFFYWLKLSNYQVRNISNLLRCLNFSFSAIKPQVVLTGITILSLATWRFPDLFMGFQSEFEALAGYAVILQIITFLLNLSDQHLRMVRVRLADSGRDNFLISSRYFIVECLLFSAFLSLLGIIATELSINFFLPSAYSWISSLVIFVPIFLILYSLNGLYGILIILMYADKAYARSVFFGSMITIVVSILLIPIFGALGAFISLTIGFFISTVLQVKNVENIFRTKNFSHKRKVLFYYYAEGNFGDDLMWSTVFSDVDPNQCSILYGKGYRTPPGYTGNVIGWFELLFKFWQYDRLCIFGGSMFMDSTNAQRKALLKLVLLSMFFKRERTSIAGINIEPFKFLWSRRLVDIIFGRSGFVWFRDHKSASEFSGLDSGRVFFVGGDMAFNENTYAMLSLSHVPSKSGFYIGVVVNPISESATLEVLRNKIISLVAEGVSLINVEFLSFQKSKDEQALMLRLCLNIMSGQFLGAVVRCECMSYDPAGGFNIVFDFYSRADFVIAGRFHGVVLALIARINYFPVVYAEKFNYFLSDLNLNMGIEVGSIMTAEQLNIQLRIGGESIERLKNYIE
ncbi:polysaccharide pyruvyl transferase family protein [Curvibacter sp. RS43]|uniref:polysaccharide pyruvyl transferase family protein n=1 Tax=Curvibacter microcysteis TaxID=3026419 RepID=UPI002360E454|nr:polysaccharide pyruvyl transferase family protein [Curvibacter sp. RS43]MDD0810221.1 polysaccharide pyruvyl transferase family protein [Curvibacter sp. RS43]